MILRKMVSSVAIATILAVSFTGCVGTKVSSLTTKQIKQEFVRGKTVTDDVRAKYGDPSEENLITLGEALDMFKAKDQSGSALTMFSQMGKIAAQSNAAIMNAKNGQVTKEDPKLKEEVEYWSYNDYEVSSPSMFNPLAGGKRKGAKLMLIFNSNTGVLIDYKFQKFSGR